MVCEMALVRNSTPTPARDVHGEPHYRVKMNATERQRFNRIWFCKYHICNW